MRVYDKFTPTSTSPRRVYPLPSSSPSPSLSPTPSSSSSSICDIIWILFHEILRIAQNLAAAEAAELRRLKRGANVPPIAVALADLVVLPSIVGTNYHGGGVVSRRTSEAGDVGSDTVTSTTTSACGEVAARIDLVSKVLSRSHPGELTKSHSASHPIVRQ